MAHPSASGPLGQLFQNSTLILDVAGAEDLGMGQGSPTQRRTTRNSSSGSPNVFSGSSRTLSRLPLGQYSITITFCWLPPCAQGRRRLEEGVLLTSACQEVPYLEPTALIPWCSLQPGLPSQTQEPNQETLSDWALSPPFLS